MASARRVAITGGAGFIGSALATALLADGDDLVLVDSLLPQVHGGRSPDVAEGTRFVQADVRDAGAMAEILDGVDVVYHLAAETGVGQSQYEIARYVDTNTTGTAVVLEAAARVGVGQAIVASSRAVYGEGSWVCPRCATEFGAAGRALSDLDNGVWDLRCPACAGVAVAAAMTEATPWRPCSVYGVTKVQQEQLANVVGEVTGLPVTVLRFFNVYGPGQSLSNPYTGVLGVFYRLAASGQAIELYEDGLPLRDFVFIDDVVRALRASAREDVAKGQAVNVALGKSATLRDVAEAVFAALGRDPMIEVSGRYRVGDVRHAVADVTRMADVLGLTAETGIDAGVRAFVAWADDQGPVTADDRAAAAVLAQRRLLRSGPTGVPS